MTCIDCGQPADRRMCDRCRRRLERRILKVAVDNGWPTVIPLPAAAPVKEIVGRTRCEDCGQPPMAEGRWCLACFQQRATPKRPTGCGTDAGYARHRRAGTQPCRPCLDAHAATGRISA